MTTRVKKIRDDIDNDPDFNFATRVAFLPQEAPPPLNAETVFVRHYEALRTRIAEHQEPGVVVFALDEQEEPAGELWLAAGRDATRAGIVGRHSQCDVIVPSQHDSVSLRHVAVLVRQTTEGAVETQVLDLATDHGFEDEEGNLQHSVTSNGSMFLRVGTVNLLLLTTPAPFSGEESAEEAYKKIPPRVFVDAVDKGDSPPPARQRHEPQTFDVRDAPTMVRTRPGPRLDFDALCDADESPVAVLSMGASDAPRVCTVGAEALDRGFLFGRYARCHLQAVEDLSTLGISRVHLLIIRSAGHMIAVDTASSNGVCVNRESTRVRALESGDELELSEDFRLTWHTTN